MSSFYFDITKNKNTITYMKKESLKIPIKSIIFYNLWLKHFPEDEGQTTWELFYLFAKTVIKNSKKEKSSIWLKNLLKKDANFLSNKKIDEYCEIFNHLQSYERVFKTHTAKMFIKNIVNDNANNER